MIDRQQREGGVQDEESRTLESLQKYILAMNEHRRTSLVRKKKGRRITCCLISLLNVAFE
jgi:hypothetical protein